MNHMMKKFTLLLATGFLFLTAFGQGVTTSRMNGRISDDSNEPLVGATVIALLESTGSQFATIADADGYFHIPNMDVGGPYSLKVTYVGYEEFEQRGIYLTLGQTFKVNVNMSETSIDLGEVLIVGRTNDYNIIDGNRTGAETVVGVEQIEALPTIGRDLTDFMRLTPQAKITGGGGITIAGTNNRYNSISIDGAVNNDVFGLSAQGTNGGQAGAAPISMDAIEQFQIALAPYDVRQSGFSGAGINAVTRRGTNQVKGSAYFYFRNDGLAGVTPTEVDSLEEKLDPFSSKTYGFRLGGPIIKNKLFFFVSAEQQREETPQPFNGNDYTGDASVADIDALSNHLINTYGYDPGGYTANSRRLDADRLFARLDWNINAKHKLMFRHSYTNSRALKPDASSSRGINFYNSAEYFPSVTNSTALELKSHLSATMANDLIIGFTSVFDDRDPYGDDFPNVEIEDGNGTIVFGSEPYSTANQLKQNILTITDNFNIYRGKHTFLVGANIEFSSTYNLFMRKAFGQYVYSSYNDFMTNQSAAEYDRGYSLVDDISGDGSAAAAEFNMFQWGVYAQDEIQVSDKLKVTAGIRVDMPMFLKQPEEDTYFNNTAIGLIEAEGYDMEDAQSGQLPKGSLMFSPRVGFNYDVMGDQTTQVRGGMGIFTSRLPLVWPGGSYTNNGLTIGGVYYQSAWGNPIMFRPDVDNQYQNQDFGGADAIPSGQMDLFVKKFKFPQVFRVNLAVDQKLPYGLIATIEGMFTKTLNNVDYKNLNIEASDGNYTGADTRPRYPGGKVVDEYTRIMLGSNTNKGYSYNITAQLQKQFEKGFTGSLAYTFGESKVINDGTSSQNSSQWRYMELVNSKNNLPLSYSDFDLGHRIVGFGSYSIEYLNHLRTTITLVYTGESGSRFSWIYGSPRDLLGETTDYDDLIYIPASSSEIVLTSDNWAELDEFINGDEYLSERRGDYAERNGGRMPFEHNFDLKIAQDIFVKTGDRHQTLQLTFDIFNLANLINNDWGWKYWLNNDNYSLLSAEGMDVDGTTPTFSFNKPSDNVWSKDDTGLMRSRWMAQFGVRYIF